MLLSDMYHTQVSKAASAQQDAKCLQSIEVMLLLGMFASDAIGAADGALQL